MDVQMMRNQRSQAVVKCNEFFEQIKTDEESLYCFFEGEDDPKFYCPRIKNIRKDNINIYICNGCDQVAKAYSIIRERCEMPQIKTKFFFDKDYNNDKKYKDILKNCNAYILPAYSIENYYYCKNVIAETIKVEFCINEYEEDFKASIKKYELFQEMYKNNLRTLNYFYFIVKELRKDKIDFNNFNTCKYFEKRGELDYSFPQLTFETLTEFFNQKAIKKTEIKKAEIFFSDAIDGSKYRGKNLIVFLQHFIEDLRLLNERGKFFKIKRKGVSICFHKNNYISVLQKYITYPESLNEFLAT